MSFFRPHQDSISTVQLSPFGEDQWHRIVTYSPIYVHWTDMLMMPKQQRAQTATTTKNTLGKVNLIGTIDINNLKLEDEILLHELYDIKKAAAVPSATTLKEKTTTQETKVLNNEKDERITSPAGDDQTSSIFSQETKEQKRHHCSYAEPSFVNQQSNSKRSVVSNQTISVQVTSLSSIKKLPNIGLNHKPQPSLSIQLRQSAIAREHATANNHRSASPLSISSSKRTTGSAYSNLRQQQQYRTIHSQTPSLSNETNPASSVHEQLTGEPLSSAKRSRIKSASSSRSTMHMLKTKNDRTRQKQHVELKTLLVEPWKQAAWTDSTLEESIPNSLEVMHTMCGPATSFERNLRQNYHRQLYQYRNGSMKC